MYLVLSHETYFDSSSAVASAASRDGCHAYSSPQPLDTSVTSDVRVEVKVVRRRKRDNKAIVQETAEVPALWSLYYEVLFPALDQFLKIGMSSQTWSDICLSDIYFYPLRMQLRKTATNVLTWLRKDVALCCYDESSAGSYPHYPLSSATQPPSEAGLQTSAALSSQSLDQSSPSSGKILKSRELACEEERTGSQAAANVKADQSS